MSRFVFARNFANNSWGAPANFKMEKTPPHGRHVSQILNTQIEENDGDWEMYQGLFSIG